MKTVLITGGNRGIGLSFVKHYIKDGWKVIATARRPEEAFELRDISSSQLRVEQLDICDQASITQLKERLKGIKINLLINNAGIYKRDNFDTLDPSEMVTQFRVNSIGPLMVTQALVEKISIPNELTKVVNITSRMGSIGDASCDSYGYRASKAALNMFTKLLAADFQKNGQSITVIALHPGYVQTDMTGKRGDISPEESVAKMVGVIDSVGEKESGSFYNRDGQIIPW